MNQIFFLQATPAGPGGFPVQYIFLGGMILVFWLFFIRPQAKRAKTQKKFIEDLQPGDKIVTIAGIHGKINRVNTEDNTLNIEVSPGGTKESNLQRDSIIEYTAREILLDCI